jgi:hypothetical protein
LDDEQGPWWTRPAGNGDGLVGTPDPPAPSLPSQQQPRTRWVAAPQSPAAEPTETLPTISDHDHDFDPGPGPGGDPNDPLGHLREDPQGRTPANVNGPSGRLMMIVTAVGLLVLLAVLAVLISRNNAGTAAAPSAVKKAVAAAAASTAKEPNGLKRLTDGEAVELLRRAGETGGGSIVEAWSWTDANGRNLVVTSTTPAGGGRQTLRVTQIAQLDGSPKTLRVMRDPNLPDCHAGGTAEFTKNSMIIRDLNGDNIADVTVGWSSRCAGQSPTSRVRLALITNGDKYIIRGDGVIGHPGNGSAVPAPQLSRWPASFRRTLTDLYHKLYY